MRSILSGPRPLTTEEMSACVACAMRDYGADTVVSRAHGSLQSIAARFDCSSAGELCAPMKWRSVNGGVSTEPRSAGLAECRGALSGSKCELPESFAKTPPLPIGLSSLLCQSLPGAKEDGALFLRSTSPRESGREEIYAFVST